MLNNKLLSVADEFIAPLQLQVISLIILSPILVNAAFIFNIDNAFPIAFNNEH